MREMGRSEEHTSELQSPDHLVCRLLLEKKKPRARHPPHLDSAPPAPVAPIAPPRRRPVGRPSPPGPGPAIRPRVWALLRVFFFNDGAPPEISPLPLHAALPF